MGTANASLELGCLVLVTGFKRGMSVHNLNLFLKIICAKIKLNWILVSWKITIKQQMTLSFRLEEIMVWNFILPLTAWTVFMTQKLSIATAGAIKYF